MKRQRKNKKLKLPSFFEDFKTFAVKKTANIAVAIIFLIVAFLLVKAFLYRSDYFRLRSVDTKESFLDQRTETSIHNQLMSLYGNRNIFKINLNFTAQSLQATYPDARQITVRIALPDKLIVNIKFRKPVALVRTDRDYPIDEEGFVLPKVDPGAITGLPVIQGVTINDRKGKRVSSGNLRYALALLKEIKRSHFTGEHAVAVIDAGDWRNLSFYLKEGPEIRIGGENFRDRLDALEKTLKDPRLALERIKYIDLRFKDVVIGPE